MLTKPMAGSISVLISILILPIGVAGCGSSSSADKGDASASIDLANTRNLPSSLDSSSVARLEPVWSRSLQARSWGSHYVGSPVVYEDVVYLQDPRRNVEAIDLADGKLLWEKNYDATAEGAFGLTVGDGLVFGATPTAAFALDAKTGREVWSTNLADGLTDLIDMTPGYHDGRVYFATSPAPGQAGSIGVLWALDATTGKRIWRFKTLPQALWGHPDINFGGGIYYTPAFDGQGSVYVGIGHAGPIPGTEEYPWGSSRPGRNLFSNSIVRLNEKTGRVEWYYQITPHGVCNGFLISPVLAEPHGRKVALGVGLLGVLVAVDRNTGRLLWRTPVGIHNGHDNDGLLAMRGKYGRLKTPMTVYPGTYGGVAAPLSVQGPTGLVPVVNEGTRLRSQTEAKSVGTPTGELVAVNIGTGAIKWKRRLPAPLFGPTTVTNDLVFATTSDGGLFAFEVGTGEEVWKKRIPMTVEGGMTISGDTLLVRAGAPASEEPKLLAYRLGD